MTLIITLFAVGLVCLFFEVFTPSGILGAIAAIILIVACALTWYNYGASYGVASIFGALILAGITVYVELFILPKTKIGKQMFNDSAITGVSQPAPATLADVLGRECEAITTLAPTGYVLLEGKRYEARCLDGYVEKGAHLVINSLDNFTLQVTKK